MIELILFIIVPGIIVYISLKLYGEYMNKTDEIDEDDGDVGEEE